MAHSDKIKTIQFNGSTVSYRVIKSSSEAKDSTPVVFLHGTNSDGNSSYGKIVDAYFTERNVILIDYAGCGQSTLPAEKIDVDYLAEQVISVITDLAVSRFDLVGHSLGAVVSLIVAAKCSEQVRKLVLSAPWRDSSDPRHQLLFGLWLSLEKDNPKTALSFGLTHALSPAFLSKLGSETINAICQTGSPPDTDRRIVIGMNANIEPFINQVNCPCLIIGCRQDTLIPPYMVKQVADGITGSCYCEVDSGHAVQIENPNDWSVVVAEFLASSVGGD